MRQPGRTPRGAARQIPSSPIAAGRLDGHRMPERRLAGRRLAGTLVVAVLAGCGARGTTTAPVVLTVEPCASASRAPAVVCSARPIATSTSDETGNLAAVPRSVAGAPTIVATTTSSVVAIPATNAPTPSLTTPGATSDSTAAAATTPAPAPTAGASAAAAAASPAAQTPEPVPAANEPGPAADPAPAPQAEDDPSDDSEPAPPPVKRQPRTTPPPPAPPPPVAKVGGGVSAQVVQLANAERAKAGLGALTVDNRLAAAAAGHSTDQATMNRMDHTGSDGSSMADRINASGFRWRALGENVAVGYQDAASVMTGWMNSAGHRKNILTAGFTVIGVAAAASADGTYYWTMDLGTPG